MSEKGSNIFGGKGLGVFTPREILEGVLEAEAESNQLMVQGAKVICTASDGDTSECRMIKNGSAVMLQGSMELGYKDTTFSPLFEKCKEGDQICEPEIENEEWQGYDETHKTGNGDYAFIKDKSYMVCTKGFGVIYATEDGQRKCDRELKSMYALMEKWLETGEAGYQKGMSFCSSYSKDPVNLNTGNFIYEHKDLTIAGIMPLAFKRFYNALDDRKGSLGEGWIHNYEMHLEIKEDAIILFLDDGKEEQYQKVSEDLYVNGHTGLESIQVRKNWTDVTYLYTTFQKDCHIFNKEGKEIRREDRNGNHIVFHYNEQGQIIRAETGSATLHYNYNEGGFLAKVWDHTGREIIFTYEGESLVQVTDSEGNSIAYTYGINNKIEEITNARGIKTVKNEYDEQLRTTKQIFPDEGEMYYSYNDEEQTVTVTEQNGNCVKHYYDEKYRNIKSVYDNGQEAFSYNEQNKRTKYRDKRGNVTWYAYDNRGNETKRIDALGNRIHKTYNQQNKLLTLSVNGIRKIKNTYDSKGNLIQVTDGILRSTNFTYNKSGQPATLIQPNGSKLQSTYDERGNLIELTDQEGYQIRYVYDDLNRVAMTTDANGNIRGYQYDDRHNIVRITNAEGKEQRYTYNQSGKVVSFTDYDGSIRYWEYGVLNKPSKLIDALGKETILEYDKMWNVSKRVEANGGETLFSYNRYNLIESITGSNGGTIFYEYDENGNRTKIIGPEGEVTELFYDELNRIIQVIEPENAIHCYTYDAEGRVTKYTDAMGNETEYVYDAAGQKIKETDPLGQETSYLYNELSQITEIKREHTPMIRYEYDSRGLLSYKDYLDGKYEKYTYDGNQSIIKKVDQNGYELEYIYDCLDRISSIRSNQGQEITYAYDAVGNLVSMTNAKGYTTRYLYDPCGNLISIIDPEGNQTLYEYDPLGNLIKVIQGEGTLFEEQEESTLWGMDFEEVLKLNKKSRDLRVTTYQRDKAGQVEQIIDSLENIEQYTYNHSGKLTQKKDKDGYDTSYRYTNAGDLDGITYADGREVKLSYNPLRQLIQMEDWLGITRVENDALGRTVKVTDHKNREISYSWGLAGERKSITYPDGKKVYYGYDEFLRLKEVKDGNMDVSYTYDELGYLREKVFSCGQKTMYDYNAAGQLQSLRHINKKDELDRYEYEYDSLGNKIGIKKRREGLRKESGSYQYGYDPLNRLQKVIKDGKLQRNYQYDGYGNRTGLVEGEKSTRYVYNALNQLVSKADSRFEGDRSNGAIQSEENYTYDKRGNLTDVYKNEKLTNQYFFGALNRLEKAVNHETGLGATYTYNGLGHRIGKVEGNPLEPVLPTAELKEMRLNPTKRIDDVLDMTKQYHNLLQRHENSNATSFLWDNNVLSSVGEDESHLLYFRDDLGSPIRLIDADGREREVYGYDEFGNDLYNKQSIVQPFGYTGYQYDTIANTYYAQAREYRPEVGRFVSEDIIKGIAKYPFTLNAYIYSWNRPIDLVDMNGRSPEESEELIVFIDPGHGGDELGAVRFSREYVGNWPLAPMVYVPYFEKDINLQVSLKVRDILESHGVTVYLSRTIDIDVDLDERARLANESGADLFISIHHNSNNPFKKGTEVYYPLKERHGDRSDASSEIARIINSLVFNNTSLKDRGIHEGNLYVLNQTNMLAILTETGYMGGDIRFLRNEDNLQEVAENIALGILMSFSESEQCLE